MPPELVTVTEAIKKLDVSRATFYNVIHASAQPLRRYRYAGKRQTFYDMRQLRPLFEKPRLVKG